MNVFIYEIHSCHTTVTIVCCYGNYSDVIVAHPQTAITAIAGYEGGETGYKS